MKESKARRKMRQNLEDVTAGKKPSETWDGCKTAADVEEYLSHEARSVASQFNKEHGWNADAAMTLAHEVLEDVNHHGAARSLHAAMDPIPPALIPGAIEAMWMRGGGFARQMAAAWRMADHGNRELIEVAFRHLILPYVANNDTGFSPGDRVTFSACDRGTVRAVADGLVQVDFDDGGEGWHKPCHLVAASE